MRGEKEEAEADNHTSFYFLVNQGRYLDLKIKQNDNDLSLYELIPFVLIKFKTKYGRHLVSRSCLILSQISGLTIGPHSVLLSFSPFTFISNCGGIKNILESLSNTLCQSAHNKKNP